GQNLNIILTYLATVNFPGLIDQLRAEKFDAAISEDPVGFGIFTMVGIEKTAWAISFANSEFTDFITQMPSAPSYVPSILSEYGDRMTFRQRILNTIYSFVWRHVMKTRIEWL
ncbi:hypothetical protein PMAYCL1PPCAC_19709, partial [Pristionchus mayeri]